MQRRAFATFKTMSLKYGFEARRALFRGIDKLATAVGVSLGPSV